MTSRVATSPNRWEFAFLVAVILALAGGLSAFLPGGQFPDRPQTDVQEISEAGDAAKQVMLSLFYITNVIFLVRFVRPWTWWFIGLPLLALILWCFASTGWSVLPDGTIRRAVAMAGAASVGLYAGLRFDERSLTAAICWAASLAVIGSAVWTLTFRSFGIDLDGYMRGLFFHKDAFGAFLGLCLTTVIYRLFVLQDSFGRHVPLIFGILVCLVLAGSSTSMLAIVIASAMIGLVGFFGRGASMMRSSIPLALSLIVVTIFVAGPELAGAAAETLGRDATFSGRLPIWRFVVPMIGERPWLGYGYGIFWLGDNSPAALFWYWSKQYELHAHNGYLQLLLDTGIVGSCLFVISLTVLIARTVWLDRLGMRPLSQWIAAYLAYFFVDNFAASDMWQPNNLMTALYVWAVVRVNLEIWRVSAMRTTTEAFASRPGSACLSKRLSTSMR